MNTHEHTRIGSLLRGIALVAVVLTGLLSILATVPSGGQPPRGAVACAGRDQQVKTGTVVRLDARCSSLTEWAAADDYLRLSWLFMRRPAGSAAALSDATAIDPSFTADAEGIYVLELFARSTSTSSIDRGEVTITATADSTNATPVAHAGSSRHVKVGDSPALDGSRSADADGERLSYEWTLTEPLGTGITITDADTATPVFDTPVSTIYRFQLQVNDGNLDSAPDRVDVRVSNDALNACPDADAGPDQRVPVGTLVTLDGSATDAESDPMTLRWRMLWRPDGSNAVLDEPLDNPAPTFTADVAGSYAIRLAADDSGTLVSRANCADRLLDVRDTVLVTASAGNSGPVANAGPDRSVDLQATVQLNGAGSSDADGDVLEYAWSFVALPMTSTAALSDATAVDPTFNADVAGSYVLRLVVRDVFASDSDTVVVVAAQGTVGPTRPVADAGLDQTVARGATVLLDGSDSSDPNGDPLTYLWAFLDWPGAPADPAPMLSDATSATPTFIAAADGSYVLRLSVSDGAETSVPDMVTVTALSGGGACADPLNLVTALPFQPGLGEVASVIQIDGDDLRVVPGDMPLDIDVIEARIPDLNEPSQAEFVNRPLWEEISRSHPNPVSDSADPSFVVRQTVDDVYYKLDVEFTGDPALGEVRIDALAACRCGADPDDCPP